jgi:hypothetical protein
VLPAVSQRHAARVLLMNLVVLRCLTPHERKTIAGHGRFI